MAINQRKTSEQIKTQLLEELKDGPASTKKLSDSLGSNWSTVNSYLKKLEEDKKVREIYSKENLKVYVRNDYPVFYGLPLDKEKLKRSVSLLSKIVERWNIKKKEQIAKTPLQKIAVEIIKKNNLDIPVVRFHYGKVLATPFNPQDSKEIIKTYGEQDLGISDKIIDEEIEKHKNIAWWEKKEQYESHEDMKIFKLSDKIFYKISNNKIDGKEILNKFNKILVEMPIGEEYSYLFDKYHEFIIASNSILRSKEFKKEKKEYLREILDAFNSLWQGLTTQFFFEDIKPLIHPTFKEIVESIKDSRLNACYFDIETRLDNLLGYKNSLTLEEIKLDETEEKMLNVFLEGANEE